MTKRGRPSLSADQRRALLKLARSARGQTLSVRALAAETGVSTASVSRILRAAGIDRSRKVPSSSGEETGLSLRSVAARAGVSVSTASRALRGSSRVRPETRLRVEEAAAELGYAPHPYVGAQLAAVRRGRLPRVDAVLAYLWEGAGKDASFEDVLKMPYGPIRKYTAAKAAAARLGYRVETFRLFEPGRSAKRLRQILLARGIRGMLIDAPRYTLLDSGMDLSGFQCVSFMEADPLHVDVVGPDFFRDVMHIYLELWGKGYRRIGFLTFDSGSTSTLFARNAGFRHAQHHVCPPGNRISVLPLDTMCVHFRNFIWKGKEPFEINRVGECDWLLAQDWKPFLRTMKTWENDRAHQAILKKWLEQNRPDALICEHMDTVSWLADLGYSVPGDIAVAHTNLNEDVAGWSGIRRPDEELAAMAVQRIVEGINLGRASNGPPVAVRLPGTWVEGRTTGRIQNPTPALTRSAGEWVERMQ